MATTTFNLRPCQSSAVRDALSFVESAPRGSRRAYVSPTGSGKSVIELEVLRSVPNAALISPTVEILEGHLRKLGYTSETLNFESEEAIISAASQHGIYTPVRLRNRLLEGVLRAPSVVIYDELHHQTAETYQQIDLLCGRPTSLGYTATYYRGTPKGTQDLRASWPDYVEIISLEESAKLGYVSFPKCRVEPLVDDDLIEIRDGDFVVSQVEAAYESSFERIADIARKLSAPHDEVITAWHRPTMFSAPSVALAKSLTRFLNEQRLQSVCVTGETSRSDRSKAFRHALSGTHALVQVNVVSEGVDLPIRVLVDLSPRVSPVAWMQQIGRIMRPVGRESAPEYICCNRNLLRHAYLLEGMLPSAALREAQDAFGTEPPKRLGLRVVGFEGLGRFKATEIPCADGLKATLYCLSSVEGTRVTQYACLAHPLRGEVVWAKRQHKRSADGDVSKTVYENWQRCDAPPADFAGFASVPPGNLSDAMRRWWKRDAGKFGLDDSTEPNRRAFQALPVLSNLRMYRFLRS